MTELEREVYEAIREVRMAERKALRRNRRNYWIQMILLWVTYFLVNYGMCWLAVRFLS